MARQLRKMGFEQAFALQGGYAAWRAAYPVEPKARPISAARRDGPVAAGQTPELPEPPVPAPEQHDADGRS